MFTIIRAGVLLFAAAPATSAASSLTQTLATRFAAGATSYQNAAIAKGDGLGPGRGARLGRLGRMGR